MARGGKETVQFTGTIPAGSNKTFNYVIKSDATVERIFGKFYPGQQNSLQVRPYMELNGQRQEELVTYASGANHYMSGDDRPFDMQIDFEAQNGDQIKVYANNISAYPYTLEISFVVDYMAGKNRVG